MPAKLNVEHAGRQSSAASTVRGGAHRFCAVVRQEAQLQELDPRTAGDLRGGRSKAGYRADAQLVLSSDVLSRIRSFKR